MERSYGFNFVDFSIQTSIFGGFSPCVSHMFLRFWWISPMFSHILGVPLKPVKMQPHLASARSDQLLTSHTAAAMESKDGRAPSTTKQPVARTFFCIKRKKTAWGCHIRALPRSKCFGSLFRSRMSLSWPYSGDF